MSERLGEIELKIYEINQLFDKMFLLGAPGLGKSWRIRRLALEEAMLMGKKYFIDASEVAPGKDVPVYVKREDVDKETARFYGEYWKKKPEAWSFETFMNLYNNPAERRLMYFFIYTPATHIQPEDVAIPNVATETEYFFPKVAFWVKILSDRGNDGVWFIDEITNVVNPKVKTFFYAVIQERKVGYVSMPDVEIDENGFLRGIKIVTAGNPPEYGGVTELPSPLLNRLMVIRVALPREREDVERWIEFMNETFGKKFVKNKQSGEVMPEDFEWEIMVGAYLRGFPKDLASEEIPSSTLEPFNTPRSWTNLARWLWLVRHRDEMKLKKYEEELIKKAMATGEIQRKSGEFVTLEARPSGDKVYRYNIVKIRPYVYGWVGRVSAAKFLVFMEVEPPTIESICRWVEEFERRKTCEFLEMATKQATAPPDEKIKLLAKLAWTAIVIAENLDAIPDECFGSVDTRTKTGTRLLGMLMTMPYVSTFVETLKQLIFQKMRKKLIKNFEKFRQLNYVIAVLGAKRFEKAHAKVGGIQRFISINPIESHLNKLTYDWWRKHAGQ